jgi:periplasmic copper chaperone A
MTIELNRTYRPQPANRPQQRWMALGVAAFTCLMLGTMSSAVAAGLTVEKPWMRFIIKARPAGGYFTLHNNTSKQIELTGASSSACGMVMLHQTKEINGVEHMLPVKSIAVLAHGTLMFKPGGYHLMCMKPKDTMVIGHEVPVTLKFADGSTITKQFPVKGPGDK